MNLGLHYRLELEVLSGQLLEKLDELGDPLVLKLARHFANRGPALGKGYGIFIRN